MQIRLRLLAAAVLPLGFISAEPLNEIVIFGASYCQAGEPTPAGEPAPSNPSPYYGGRYADGYTFGEYMKNATGATLYDYGVGGAHIDPDLTDGGYYSSQEVDAYIQGIQDGSIRFRGDGLSVHIWWVGLNPIKNDVLGNLTDQPEITQEALDYAHLRSRRNADAVLGQATAVSAALEPYSQVTPLMLLLPIPPLELVPQVFLGSDNSTEELDAAAALTDTFNVGLFNGSSSSGNDSSNFVYWAADNWWRDLANVDFEERGPYNGTMLDLSVVDEACLVLENGDQCAPCTDTDRTDICDNPGSHLYWDSLHPTTIVQEDLSIQLISFLNATNATTSAPEPVASGVSSTSAGPSDPADGEGISSSATSSSGIPSFCYYLSGVLITTLSLSGVLRW